MALGTISGLAERCKSDREHRVKVRMDGRFPVPLWKVGSCHSARSLRVSTTGTENGFCL